MANDCHEASRRTVLKHLSVAGTTLAGLGSVSTASAKSTQSQSVSKGLAKKAVEQKRQQLSKRDEFGDWATASLAQPETFYTHTRINPVPKYEKSAYVFPITKNGTNLGYITASAKRSNNPILEYSRATPPQQRVSEAKQIAQKKGRKPTGRLLYRGGVSYNYELEGREAVQLGGRYVKPLPDSAPISNLNFDTPSANSRWDRLTAESKSNGTVETQDSVSTSSLPGTVAIDSIPGYAEDYEFGKSDVKGNNYYPDYLGNGDDYWGDYDGCAPYAGANVLGYYEGIGQYDWDARNELIDRMHYRMDTGDDIYTTLSEIAPGIEEYSNGQHSYSANTQYNYSAHDLKQSLYDFKPALLTMADGGSPEESGYPEYGPHTVAVSAYEERSDGLYWGIYDSYDYDRHWIANGNWSDADTTFVSKN